MFDRTGKVFWHLISYKHTTSRMASTATEPGNTVYVGPNGQPWRLQHWRRREAVSTAHQLIRIWIIVR